MPSSTSSSENAYPAPKTDFFDPEHVERPVPALLWPRITMLVIALTAALTIGWEFYWRSRDYVAGDFKNTPALWATQRRRAVGDATVLIGSSRMFFDANLDVWQQDTGIRPIQLSLEGTSPQAFLADLGNDEKFHGTVFVGITAPLFFTGFQYRKEVLDYARKESLSQRADHVLANQLEKIFAFIDEMTRPKTIIHFTEFPVRKGMHQRIDTPKIEIIAEDRNSHVWPHVVKDKAFADFVRRGWADAMKGGLEKGPDGKRRVDISDDKVSEIVADMNASIDKIRARGGDVAFVRFPCGGDLLPFEAEYFPDARFWDRLVNETGSAGIHWKDYPQLQGYYLPEWSHIEAEDAKRYTHELTPILYAEMKKKRAEREGR